MDFKQIKELINLVNDSNIGELLIEDKEFKLRLRHQNYSLSVNGVAATLPQAAMAPAPPAQESSTAPEPAGNSADAESEGNDSDDANLTIVKSPMIGTFYRSSGPDKPPYVKVGDHVDTEDVLCIIEAMKLFNEIESEISGRIVKVLVENEAPVEYDQPLFLVDPNG